MSLIRPQPGEPRRDKLRRAGFWIIALVALAIVSAALTRAAAGGASSGGDDNSRFTPNLPTEVSLTFEISGAATEATSISYLGNGFQITQETNVPLPWTKTVSYTSGTTGVNINAQNAGSGTIACSITRDGQLIAQNESSGDYAVVGCAVP